MIKGRDNNNLSMLKSNKSISEIQSRVRQTKSEEFAQTPKEG